MIHINRLVLIAGPSCSGKSSLIKSLIEGSLPLLCEKLELGDAALWNYVKTKQIETITDPAVDRMIWHYNLTRMWNPEFKENYMEERHRRVIDASNEITVVTLWTSPKALQRRNIARTTKHLFWNFSRDGFYYKLELLRNLHKIKKRHMLYKNPLDLYSLYNRWFEFCKKIRPKAHLFVDTTEKAPKIISFEQLVTYTSGGIESQE